MSTPSPIAVSVEFGHAPKGQSFTKGTGKRTIIDWNSDDKPTSMDGVKYALVWKISPDMFDSMPDLEVIFSAGAGVDKIMAMENLPDVPIVRFVDHTLTTRMSEWVSLQCLLHLRQHVKYDAHQKRREWVEIAQPQASDITVGIMGLGVLGQDSAKKLNALGFNVCGWSRTKKQIENVECFDETQTSEFLAKTDFLVGLLPLTPDTKGFFNRPIFEQLNKRDDITSPVFINAGRGQSQVEADIISCLQDGVLKAASLDVFATEPLQKDSPLWEMENVIITPHCAANSDIAALWEHVENQITRHENGDGLQHVVDRNLGY